MPRRKIKKNSAEEASPDQSRRLRFLIKRVRWRMIARFRRSHPIRIGSLLFAIGSNSKLRRYYCRSPPVSSYPTALPAEFWNFRSETVWQGHGPATACLMGRNSEAEARRRGLGESVNCRGKDNEHARHDDRQRLSSVRRTRTTEYRSLLLWIM